MRTSLECGAKAPVNRAGSDVTITAPRGALPEVAIGSECGVSLLFHVVCQRNVLSSGAWNELLYRHVAERCGTFCRRVHLRQTVNDRLDDIGRCTRLRGNGPIGLRLEFLK